MSSSNILLIDDDAAILRSLTRSLDECGLSVETATCAAEARAVLNHYEIGAVVCDHQMPGQTGLEFLAELKKEQPELILFLLSGRVAGFDMAEKWGQEIGIQQIFSKPCDVDELSDALTSALAAQQEADD